MKIPVFTLAGKSSDAWNFAESVLGKYNEALLAQALRIYESNSHQKTHKVLTRGEVDGSTKKIYRQKGTGNARHGAKYAPIFVGGGIAHGPTGVRPENLILPKKMKRKSLATALLGKLQEGSLVGLAEIKKATGKTSAAVSFLSTTTSHPKDSVLLITEGSAPTLFRMVRSLQGVTMKRASLVNAFDLVSHDKVVLTKKAFDSLISRTQALKAKTI